MCRWKRNCARDLGSRLSLQVYLCWRIVEEWSWGHIERRVCEQIHPSRKDIRQTDHCEDGMWGGGGGEGGRIWNIVSAYAPQTGRPQEEDVLSTGETRRDKSVETEEEGR